MFKIKQKMVVALFGYEFNAMEGSTRKGKEFDDVIDVHKRIGLSISYVKNLSHFLDLKPETERNGSEEAEESVPLDSVSS